jgi:acetoin utilization protein AcuC
LPKESGDGAWKYLLEGSVTKTAFVYSPKMAQYELSPDHPLRPERLALTFELASEYGLFTGDSRLVEPIPAEESDILTFHTPEYVRAVRELSVDQDHPSAWRFGFGPLDNPPFPGMYEASLLYTGASVTAAELVMSGQIDRAFNISGGLHHAKAGKASGFCIFNDPVIAINHLLRQFERVAYIDIDAHHGDGVQAAFYDTDRVLNISIHESGEYLFPGTGFVHEIGEGAGRGYAVNIPLAPLTTDEWWLWAFHEIVPPLISAYAPEVIVAQLGVDSHFSDPLAHLNVSSDGFIAAVRTILGFGKPMVALGGGGYNLSVVPRLWTLAYAEMARRELPDEIPEEFARLHGIRRLRDGGKAELPPDQETHVKHAAEETVASLRRIVFPLHGLALSR